jgi:hypothetical protein
MVASRHLMQPQSQSLSTEPLYFQDTDPTIHNDCGTSSCHPLPLYPLLLLQATISPRLPNSSSLHMQPFPPALSTLTKALKLSYIRHFPGLSDETLAKHPPQSVAMTKGHLDQSHKNARSTKPGLLAPTDLSDPAPVTELDDPFPISDLAGNRSYFCFVATAECTGKLFTDQTGRFILPSSTGNTQLFIMYCYDSNYIYAEPMQSKSATEILNAYKRAHTVLTDAGLRQQLQRLNNEASILLKQFMKQEAVDFQLVPPGVHRGNAAERAICRFKNCRALQHRQGFSPPSM